MHMLLKRHILPPLLEIMIVQAGQFAEAASSGRSPRIGQTNAAGRTITIINLALAGKQGAYICDGRYPIHFMVAK